MLLVQMIQHPLSATWVIGRHHNIKTTQFAVPVVLFIPQLCHNYKQSTSTKGSGPPALSSEAKR